MRRSSLFLVTLTSLAAALAACNGSSDGDPPASSTTTQDPPVTEPPVDPLPEEVTSVLDLPETPHSYADLGLPAHYDTPFIRDQDNTPADNPITDDGATLGRVLFYDTALSANDTVACASCHIQEHAFTDPGTFSEGFEGGFTDRNSMSLIDSRYYRNGRFFWDERADTLEDQVLQPIQNEVEMGLTLDELVTRVSGKAYYPPLFERAFGDAEISSDRISLALAQFVRSIVSFQSRFDEGLIAAGAVEPDFDNFTAQENQGKALFLGPAGCAACHLDSGPPQPGPRVNTSIFFIAAATNNGLDGPGEATDMGVGDVTFAPQDDGRFKSPSLRNVSLTGPYMHDGRFETLAEVVEHYNSGVQAHPNLDRRLTVPGSNPPAPRQLNLTQAQKDALVAFMEALTDEAVIADPKYTNPFR